jgi:rfaE bifunctional protein nucleotidyltransferase chain/domain
VGQVFKFSEIKDKIAPHRQKKIVFTNGVFDLLHVGHVRYLKEARALGDYLIIGVNSDASVKRLKGKDRPLQNENDRAEILTSLACVDAAVIFTEDTPEKLIHEVKPQVLVKGGDWKIENIVGAQFVQSLGGQVFSLNFVDGRSTTNLIEKART